MEPEVPADAKENNCTLDCRMSISDHHSKGFLLFYFLILNDSFALTAHFYILVIWSDAENYEENKTELFVLYYT